MAAEIWT